MQSFTVAELNYLVHSLQGGSDLGCSSSSNFRHLHRRCRIPISLALGLSTRSNGIFELNAWFTLCTGSSLTRAGLGVRCRFAELAASPEHLVQFSDVCIWCSMCTACPRMACGTNEGLVDASRGRLPGVLCTGTGPMLFFEAPESDTGAGGDVDAGTSIPGVQSRFQLDASSAPAWTRHAGRSRHDKTTTTTHTHTLTRTHHARGTREPWWNA